MPRFTLASLACALALLALPAAADSIRCDGGIVSTGDSKLDLVAKCGWPALREEQTGERVTVVRQRRGHDALQRTVTASPERWTYDFGPRRFIEIVRLELGRVVAVERGGYGYDRGGAPRAPALPRARCAPTFHEGESAYEVLARCGEPAFRDARVDVRTRILEDGAVLQADSTGVTVELWAYDFGSSTFVRLLTFEDGRLVRIETGGHGYAR